MSIYVGNFPNDVINDNRLNFNSYNNSNIIYLNTSIDSHPNAIINFKNDYSFGLSNFKFILNKSTFSNLFTIDPLNTIFNTNFTIKNSFNISNDTTFLNSNFTINFQNSNNNFIINDSSNYNIITINSNNITLNLDNSNKININNSNININENIIIHSNKSLTLSHIRAQNANSPIILENVRFNTIDILDNNLKGALNIINDISYNKPSIYVNRYDVNYNTLEFNNISNNTSNKYFSINSNGFIAIGPSNATSPIDIRISSNINVPLIFNYLTSNDNFTINNRGYIGIGTNNPNNYVSLIIKDDIRNIINNPILNFDLTYNSNLNYRTNNPISLKFIAYSNAIPVYNDEDQLINYNYEVYNNYYYKFLITSNFSPSIISPPTPNIYTINVINTINNDYIINYGISNIVNYVNSTYLKLDDLQLGNTNYTINYTIRYPRFLYIDLNEAGTKDNRINPKPTLTGNVYEIIYTNYVRKSTTINYNLNDFILKEEIIPIFKENPADPNSLLINIKQRLYIEKTIFELKDFIDSITYIYQPPPNLIYATSNNNFCMSLNSEGKLALGDNSPNNQYYLYVNKKARTDNLECLNISSITGKQNINFSYCNISNVNKGFFNSNITSYLNVKNGFFSNITMSNLYIPEININKISCSNLNFIKISNPNLFIDNEIFNSKLKMIIGGGSNILSITSNFILDINTTSNNNDSLGIFSFYENTNPSISLYGFSNNNFPTINLKNNVNSYALNMNNNNFNLTNNNSNIIYKHIYNQNLFTIGNSNNIIFDLKPVNIPTNSTNKISIGYPYRFLLQNQGYNINNWDVIFNNNQLNSSAMLNVYGNVNLSSINNTPFINCIANDLPTPYEIINICIGSNITRSGYLLNVEGNAFFSSNIYVESNVFTKGTIGNVSDIRIKDKLTIIPNPINKINQINGYTYLRKDTGKIESGLVAQEVLKILPEVVNINNGYYNISYGNLSGLLVEGIKELNKRLEIIENKLNTFNFSNNP